MHAVRWYTKVRVKITRPWKFKILPFLKSIFFAVYSGNWQMMSDS